jgi:septation ring formation regulator EzrA
MKRLIELQNLNREKESVIEKYEEEIKEIENESLALDEQLQDHEKEWSELQEKLEEESKIASM